MEGFDDGADGDEAENWLELAGDEADRGMTLKPGMWLRGENQVGAEPQIIT